MIVKQKKEKKVETKNFFKESENDKEIEISIDELLDYTDKKKDEFKAQTKKEIDSLNSIKLDPENLDFTESKKEIVEKLEKLNEEAELIVKEVKDRLELNRDLNSFNKKEFLDNFKNEIENVKTKNEALQLFFDTYSKQKERDDLKLLFNNFNLKKRKENKTLSLNDYIENEIQEMSENINSEEVMEALKEISLNDFIAQVYESLEEVTLPELNIDNKLEFVKNIEIFNDKVEVDNYSLNKFIEILNKYNELSKGKEDFFRNIIFNKGEIFLNDIEDNLKEINDDPSYLKKIDFLQKSSLDKKLNLFSESNSLSNLKSISLKSLKLLESNNYFEIIVDNNPGYIFIEVINEDLLKDVSSFDPSIKRINIEELHNYNKFIKNLDPSIKNFIKKYYLKYGDQGIFIDSNKFYNLDYIKSEEDLNKVEKLLDSGLLKNLNNISKVTGLSDKQIDLLIKLEDEIENGVDYDVLTKAAELDEVDLIDYKKIINKFSLDKDIYKYDVLDYLRDRKELPKNDLDFFDIWQTNYIKHLNLQSLSQLTEPLRQVLNFKNQFSKLSQFYRSDPDAETIIFKFIWSESSDILYTSDSVKMFENSSKKYFLKEISSLMKNFSNIDEFVKKRGEEFTQYDLDSAFEDVLRYKPELFFEKSEFPFTADQLKIVDVFKKIQNSPSVEMKNMAIELSLQIVRGGDVDTIDERYEKISNIFIKNNIPFVGKQFKVCETLHPKIETSDKSSPELHSLHSNNARKLLIFKDLLKVSFNSLNSNLENYLQILNSGQEILNKFEKGEDLSEDEEEELKYFFIKIDSLSENLRKSDNFNKVNIDEISLTENLKALRANFNVNKDQTIIEKFEDTFLKRIGINSISDALRIYNELRKNTSERNKELAINGKIDLKENDLVKGVSSRFFDSIIDRGIFSPEFVGAESLEAKDRSKYSDATPWDTDLIIVGNRNSTEIVNNSTVTKYGDVILLIRDRGQFKKNEAGKDLIQDQSKLELFKTKVTGKDHFGIRTGFGSTEIDAILIKDNVLESSRKLDSLKFSIAQKGFYIPICDKSGKVVFSENDYNEYRKIFNGIDKYHGEKLEISESWKKSKFKNDIEKFTQTKDNLEKTSTIRDEIYKEIESELNLLGIELHKGKYDDSVIGSKIIDTGSTGRGSALDTGYDFDFVIKINDNQFNKIPELVKNLKKRFPCKKDYNNSEMKTLRFKSFKKGNDLIDLDISFVKKSDSEDLDADEAVALKYNSIKNNFGEDRLLDVLTNVRFAKNELKQAECYKKGLTGNDGQQGGLGGIGVENWILKNGGDAVLAFRDFYQKSHKNGKLISFSDFKKQYKIFSAGSNIRGSVKAENFIYNMDETGYKKMAELSKKFIE